MFENFRKFLPKVSEDSEHPTHFEHHDYRLAAAALLVHTATIDGNMSDLERDQLHAVVKRKFGLDNATTDELLAEGTQAEREAVDLYHFTSLINRSIDDEGRRRIVEMMWEIIYADGRANEFESNLMWRAADIACPYDGRLTSHTVSYANAPPARHGHVLKCHDMFRRTDWPDRRGRN